MPSLKDTKRRIGSVKSTQKITRAMKLMSAAKFARANHAVHASRPYSNAFSDMVKRLTASKKEQIASPLVAVNTATKDLLVILATDRGLCGSLNTNLFKSVVLWSKEQTESKRTWEVAAWGRRAQLFARRRGDKIVDRREKLFDKPSYDQALVCADYLIQRYVSGEYGRVFIAYMEFSSAIAQAPSVKQLLPVQVAKDNQQSASAQANLLVEPKVDEIADALLRRSIASAIFRSFLEAAASEHGARMTAMDNATNNAKEVIRRLTLQYNRARQAAITKELIEIISGAEAL